MNIILYTLTAGFTPLSKNSDPKDVMMMLNELFAEYDALCDDHEVYKV